MSPAVFAGSAARDKVWENHTKMVPTTVIFMMLFIFIRRPSVTITRVRLALVYVKCEECDCDQLYSFNSYIVNWPGGGGWFGSLAAVFTNIISMAAFGQKETLEKRFLRLGVIW